MKKVFLATILTSLVTANSVTAQSAFSKGSMVVSAGYGFPNFMGLLFKSLEGYDQFKANSLGPMHGKFEYGISNKIGIGLSINYSSARVSFNDNLNAGNYNYNVKYQPISFNLRTNVHLANSERWDPYFGIGLGVGRRKFNVSSNNPDFKGTDDFLRDFKLTQARLGLGLEATFGCRFYVTPNIGIYAEVGPAKSFAQLGVAYKLGGGDNY